MESKRRIEFERRPDERLDDFIERVIRANGRPICVNTLFLLTGIEAHRLCKILNRLEKQKRIKRATLVYHSYWQAV